MVSAPGLILFAAFQAETFKSSVLIGAVFHFDHRAVNRPADKAARAIKYIRSVFISSLL